MFCVKQSQPSANTLHLESSTIFFFFQDEGLHKKAVSYEEGKNKEIRHPANSFANNKMSASEEGFQPLNECNGGDKFLFLSRDIDAAG